MPRRCAGPRGEENSSWGNLTDEERERLILITRCQMVESVLSQDRLLAEQGRGREVPKIPGALHGRACCMLPCRQDWHARDQQEKLCSAGGHCQILLWFHRVQLGPETQLPSGNSHPWKSHLGLWGHTDGCGGVSQDGVGTGKWGLWDDHYPRICYADWAIPLCALGQSTMRVGWQLAMPIRSPTRRL